MCRVCCEFEGADADRKQARLVHLDADRQVLAAQADDFGGDDDTSDVVGARVRPAAVAADVGVWCLLVFAVAPATTTKVFHSLRGIGCDYVEAVVVVAAGDDTSWALCVCFLLYDLLWTLNTIQL